MSKKSIFCIANCRNLAELIVDQLKFYGISKTDISILYPDIEMNGRKSHHFAEAGDSRATEGMLTGAGAGAVIGGTLGWIVGIGVLAVPGVGAFIAAGPVMTALSGAAMGATAGGLAGGLIALGLSERQASHFEDRIRLGNILISVHTDSPAEAMQAKFIFSRARAQEICITDEACLPQEHPSPDRDRSGLPRQSTHFWPELSPLIGGLINGGRLTKVSLAEPAGHPDPPG